MSFRSFQQLSYIHRKNNSVDSRFIGTPIYFDNVSHLK
nr:MAG TPA: hypothetical protein [Caudoviricetes sp.]